MASGSHAGPGPDPGQEDVTRIWGEKGTRGVRGETRVRDIIPATCPHVGGQGVTTAGSRQLSIPGDRDLLG